MSIGTPSAAPADLTYPGLDLDLMWANRWNLPTDADRADLARFIDEVRARRSSTADALV